jgi:hypothetical protein
MLKWTVEFQVATNWVEDGFDLTDERALNMLAADLGFADISELRAKVIAMPDALTVARLMGYKDATKVKRRRREELL